MNRRNDASRRPIELQLVYTIPELAQFGRTTRGKLRRLLEKNGVEFLRSGRMLFISVSEVREKIPSLWKGMCAIETARVIALERTRAELEAPGSSDGAPKRGKR